MELISNFFLDIICLTILFCRHMCTLLLRYVTKTIVTIDDYCKTEFINFEKLEQIKMSRKHLINYEKQIGKDLRVISKN